MDSEEISLSVWTGFYMSGKGPLVGSCERSNEYLGTSKFGKFLYWLRDC